MSSTLRSLAVLALLGGCRTVTMRVPLSAGVAPPAGDVFVSPVECSRTEPAYWGEPPPKLASTPAGPDPCAPAIVDAVAAKVDADLGAMGLRVMAKQAQGATVVRVAVALWNDAMTTPGGRVTIVLSTPAMPFTRIATCKISMYSNAAAQIIAGDPADVLGEATACALRSLRAQP